MDLNLLLSTGGGLHGSPWWQTPQNEDWSREPGGPRRWQSMQWVERDCWTSPAQFRCRKHHCAKIRDSNYTLSLTHHGTGALWPCTWKMMEGTSLLHPCHPECWLYTQDIWWWPKFISPTQTPNLRLQSCVCSYLANDCRMLTRPQFSVPSTELLSCPHKTCHCTVILISGDSNSIFPVAQSRHTGVTLTFSCCPRCIWPSRKDFGPHIHCFSRILFLLPPLRQVWVMLWSEPSSLTHGPLWEPPNWFPYLSLCFPVTYSQHSIQVFF